MAAPWSDLVANTASTDTAYAHVGLDPATTRHYRVSAINANGTGTPSNVDSATTGTTVPGAPTGLTATASGTTAIDLSWSAPASTGGSAITGYKIEVSPDGTSGWTDQVADTSSTDTTYAHTGLTAGDTRHYRVSAINTNGAGTPSNVDSATTGTTVPGAPTGLTATASGTTAIDLSWSAPASTGGSAITGYKIEVSPDGTSGWTDQVANTSNTDHHLRAHRADRRRHPPLPRLRHRRRRQRHHRHHRARLQRSTAPPPAPPASTRSAITGLRSGSSIARRLHLRPRPAGATARSTSPEPPPRTGGSAITGYKIEVSPNGTSGWLTDRGANTAAWSDLVANTGAPAPPTPRGARPRHPRHYRVSAINTNGAGTPSNVDSATTGTTVPGAPTGLTATASGTTQIDLSWSAPASTGGSAITGYKIEVSPDGTSGWTDQVANTNSTATTYAHTGLAGGDTRHYRVSAINANGAGTASNVDSATTGATAPGAPTGLTATASGATQINLSWSAPASTGGSAITGYKIEVSPNGTSGWTDQVANTNSTATTYAHTGLAAGDTRHYRVSAINAVGTSDASDSDDTTTASPNTAATGAPTITGTAAVGQPLAVDLTGIADADGLTSVSYAYQWIRVNGTEADIAGENSTTYTLVDADLGTTLKVKVSFTDDAGNSETLTSAATATVGAAGNTAATGAPTITGTAEVGETLTAVTTGIADADGLTSVSYAYQWIRVNGTEADIAGENSSTYTLVDADLGTTLKVKVSFTDDASNSETLTSAATATVGATATAPTVSNVAVTSTPASGTTYYLAGEAIEFTVTFSAPVTVTATPKFAFRLGAATRQAAYASGSDSAALVFARTVQAGEVDRNGISWNSLALALDGGTITQTGATTAARLTHAAQASLEGHRVDAAPPMQVSASVRGLSLVLVYDEPLDPASMPTTAAYTVTATVGATTTNPAVSEVSIYGIWVTLALDAAPAAGATVTLAYAPPASNPVQDEAGNDAPAFSGQSVRLGPPPPDLEQVMGVGVVPGNAQLVVTWTAVDNATGYTVQWESGGQGYNTTNRQATVTSGSTTSHTITGLANGTEYTVQVSATRTGANDGPASDEMTGTPTVPTAAGIAVSTAALTVTEQDSTGDGYTVVLDTEPTADVVVTVAGHVGTDVTANPTALTFTMSNWETAQTVTVTADDDADTTDDSVALTHSAASADSGYSGIAIAGVAVTVNDNDTAQVTGVGVVPGNAQLVVTWTAVDNATGYTVQWKSGGQGYNTTNRQATVTSGSTTSHTITGLANGTEYTVQVSATRTGADDGPPSEEETGTPRVPNTAATGAPTITGTAEVGETLTASTTGIADANGLTSPTYTYQWIRVDGTEADIAGENSSTYTLVDADLGKTLKVKVTFADDLGHTETLTSAATATVGAAATGPTVSNVAVTSTPASGTTYYLAGEAIEFTVTFSAPVTVTATPKFAFRLGAATRQAAYASGSDSAALVFARTVQAGEVDRNGISWNALALALDGGTITQTGATTAASLTHAEQAPLAGHRVDAAPPMQVSASVRGLSLVLVYDEPLDPASMPATGAYTVTATVGATTTNPEVSEVSIYGIWLTLTLDAAPAAGATVTLAYAPPASNPVQDEAGNDAPAFSGQKVNGEATDRAALVALYNATGGPNWTINTNWLTTAALSEWYGVTTDVDGRVTHVYLSQNELNGEIPVELGDLASLQILDISQNELSGAIPAKLGDLASLQILYLAQNELSGAIPAEMGDLASLQQLYLNGNTDLAGPLPLTLPALSQLSVLDIRETTLCAPVNTAFQAWLATIDFKGTVCAPPLHLLRLLRLLRQCRTPLRICWRTPEMQR